MAASVASLCVKWDEADVVPYNLFIKKHSLRKEDKKTPNEVTLFVLNVPLYWTKKSLHRIFSSFGQVEAVYLQVVPGPVGEDEPLSESLDTTVQKLKCAYIVYKNQSSAENAVKAAMTGKAVCLDDSAKPLSGMKRWCQAYCSQYPKVKSLQEEVDSYVARFHEKETNEKEEQQGVTDPDDEGWITVTKGPKKEKAKPKKVSRKEKKKKRAKELINFYQFQQREAKRDHIAELRRKFEEDKKRIALMREQRKFKPF